MTSGSAKLPTWTSWNQWLQNLQWKKLHTILTSQKASQCYQHDWCPIPRCFSPITANLMTAKAPIVMYSGVLWSSNMCGQSRTVPFLKNNLVSQLCLTQSPYPGCLEKSRPVQAVNSLPRNINTHPETLVLFPEPFICHFICYLWLVSPYQNVNVIRSESFIFFFTALSSVLRTVTDMIFQ